VFSNKGHEGEPMFIAHVISPHMHKSHMRQNTEKQSVVLSFISKAEGYLPENLHTECEESQIT
jgi:hypothetical protein